MNNDDNFRPNIDRRSRSSSPNTNNAVNSSNHSSYNKSQSTSYVSFTPNNNAYNGSSSSTQPKLNRVKRVKISLVINLFLEALIFVILASTYGDVSSFPWNIIVLILPSVEWLVYLIGDITHDEKYNPSKLNYILGLGILVWTILFPYVLVIVYGPYDFSFFSFYDIENTILMLVVTNVYSLPIFAFLANSSLKYLREKEKTAQDITFLEGLCMGLSMFLLATVIGNAVTLIFFPNVGDSDALVVGDTVILGSYEQDGDSSNGKENISWTVESIDDGKALLLSDVCLYAMPYNSGGTDNSWRNSDLRKWLNNDFYKSAFSSDELGIVCEKTIITQGEGFNGKSGKSEITTDKVFVPDSSEFDALTYEPNVSPVAKEIFLANNTAYGVDNYQSMFWIRPPFENDSNIVWGYDTEKERSVGRFRSSSAYSMVRPAVYIDVELYLSLSKDN